MVGHDTDIVTSEEYTPKLRVKYVDIFFVAIIGSAPLKYTLKISHGVLALNFQT